MKKPIRVKRDHKNDKVLSHNTTTFSGLKALKLGDTPFFVLLFKETISGLVLYDYSIGLKIRLQPNKKAHEIGGIGKSSFNCIGYVCMYDLVRLEFDLVNMGHF